MLAAFVSIATFGLLAAAWAGPNGRGGSRAHALSMNSQLKQLSEMTVLSIDTGDLSIIEDYAGTGVLTDATTNPLFVSQAGLSGDPRYVAFVDRAVAYAKANADALDPSALLELASDRLAVELGLEIVKIVPGYVSTEVDIRASFDTSESLRRARRIIAMYEAEGVPRSRVLIKLAGTWEGIQAAREVRNAARRRPARHAAPLVPRQYHCPRVRAAAAPSHPHRTSRSRSLIQTLPHARVFAAGKGGHHVQHHAHLRLHPGGRCGPGRRSPHLSLPGPDQGLALGKRWQANLRAFRGSGRGVRHAHLPVLQKVRAREDDLHAGLMAAVARHG
jgi:hypothetical protein